jgi:anti-sigma B factor antagonist
MGMEFVIQQINQCGVVALSGRMISDENVTELLQEVAQQLESGVRNWILDCRELSYCNSTGLNVFIRILTKSRNLGGDTCLVQLQPSVQKLFELSKLNEIFTSYNTVENAVTHYNSIT